jgi:uncharacterized protein YcbK (DUF882 family)
MRNFTPDEFSCNCGCGGGFSDMDAEFLDMLDNARDHAGIPFRLSSAYRCARHNEAVGGVEDSAHVSGHAVDIIARSGREKWLIEEGLRKAGFTRIGRSKSFIHADNDPSKPERVAWAY